MASRVTPSTLHRFEPDAVADELTAFINESIMARTHPIGPADRLEAAGIDSMALLKILLFIEARYGFWMPDEDLIDDNLASARALANYICGRRPPA